MWNKEISRVRCALEPFVRAQHARAHGGVQSQDKKRKPTRGPPLQIGVYQVEELRI